MATFSEANQVRLSLKMKLSNYYWYISNTIISEQDSYYVLVHVKKVNNFVRKIITPVINGVDVRTEAE